MNLIMYIILFNFLNFVYLKERIFNLQILQIFIIFIISYFFKYTFIYIILKKI